MPTFGERRVCAASEYWPACEGFVIEEYCFAQNYTTFEGRWALPDWEERSLGHLAGVFATRSLANRAINEAA